MTQPKQKNETETANKPAPRCFLCGQTAKESAEKDGSISFEDNGKQKNIHVCHACTAIIFQDLMARTTREQRQQVIGEVMYQRALETRTW